MENGSSKSLFTLLAIVIFGIFLSLSYWMFQEELTNVLASVMEKTSETTSIKLENNGQFSTELKYFKYTVINSKEIKITEYDKNGGSEVIIPAFIDGLPVTTIASEAFNNKGLVAVTLPETLVTLESGTTSFIGAFSNNNLTELKLPTSLKIIGNNAFINNKIKVLKIPDNVLTIGVAAFRENELTSVSIGKGLSNLSWGLFYSNNLTSITIPSNITKINAGALNSNKLSEVNLPETLLSIDDHAFSCNLLTEFTVPKSVTSLGIGFVDRNTTLKKLYIPISLQALIISNQRIVTNLLVYNNTTKVYDSITFYGSDIINYY